MGESTFGGPVELAKATDGTWKILWSASGA